MRSSDLVRPAVVATLTLFRYKATLVGSPTWYGSVCYRWPPPRKAPGVLARWTSRWAHGAWSICVTQAGKNTCRWHNWLPLTALLAAMTLLFTRSRCSDSWDWVPYRVSSVWHWPAADASATQAGWGIDEWSQVVARLGKRSLFLHGPISSTTNLS